MFNVHIAPVSVNSKNVFVDSTNLNITTLLFDNVKLASIYFMLVLPSESDTATLTQ